MKRIISFLTAFFVCCTSYSQSVGIGTNKPLEKLHVDGNIKSDTIKPNAIKLPLNAGNGKILTSDAEGNASWQKINKGSGNESNLSVPGNIGYGVWGDCATNGNISDYQPVPDTAVLANYSFGHSVSMFGNYAIVGIPGDKVGANMSQGSANIYRYDGTQWVLMQKITDPGGAGNDKFGWSVCITDKFAMVGAIYDDFGAVADQGSVSIFQFNGTNWVWMQKINDAAGGAADYYGASVSISGELAVVGSSWDDHGASIDQGSALFYKYNGTNWVLLQKVFDAIGLPNDFFGHSVSISGNYAIIGAYWSDVGSANNQGVASVYRYNGTNWIWMQRITDTYGAAGDQFGKSVSISGNYAIVGANLDDVDSNTDQGSASIYQLIGPTWIFREKITEATGAVDDHFGTYVSITGNYAMVGSSDDNVSVNENQGSANIYQRVGIGWQRLQYITDPGGKRYDSFSSGGVSIQEATKQFIVGVPTYAGYAGKVVFGKIN